MDLTGIFPPVVRKTLDAIGLAELKIKRARRRFPERDAELHAAFRLLRPTDPLDGTETLYVAHVDEILDRVVRGEDTRPGTRAEVLGGLLIASRVAPLREVGLALAERLLAEVAPRISRRFGPPIGREAFPGELDDELRTARRKLSSPWRTR